MFVTAANKAVIHRVAAITINYYRVVDIEVQHYRMVERRNHLCIGTYH